ncbi:Uncharacterised protein [Nocardia otitidiscaviarum]|uniref:Uncharacterized protein n=1 Tax=Nocardia otitidiscaviarum TaxID=1823 RepID=A0A379JK15_9NOCA|nr:hypothetical protein [Nocardia otitidiscaviarum]MBF6180401.1 hypothetical protein [Nocardia otitidiscaviarum]MCP9618555.1 hypothetical protein [Nocardia otitidiscaviarum]QDP79353.1 hypothetical protein FOH10_12135 [Nocardia otitidiscaviarum]SUD48838.1 Uncharacterised protein [Nocardia otitidiscaviarum]
MVRHGNRSTNRTARSALAHPRPPIRRAARSEPLYPPGWLLLELPTAILLAVFIGTGWLGYAHPTGPTHPQPAVVVPLDTPTRAE